jgi:putative lipoic acid-binding regulatory protein
MVTLKDKEQKLELQYPCSWSYKIIANEKESIVEAICEVVDTREHTLTSSKSSKGGKYISMNLDILVHNEDDRNFIYEALKKHQLIKMVL